ncbi:hypothetical protein DSM104299_04280 [Baekduia alba]|uniref:hypothetical protein n=1 Tax=Baekduia alba TaxID=2997333 RepID=UPI0023409EB4|nr:hypothetical protein [Baekduia alba]WCB95531.1 hypothetical protein DSM104299_04280 [Baekduia alba]
MHRHHPDMKSSYRHGWRFFSRLACVVAVAFALVAACVGVAPAALTTSAPSATAAADTCPAQILKSGKLVPVYEKYYKYTYKKIKGTKKYRKVIVSAKRKLQVSCTRACVRTKSKKTKKYKYKTVVRKGKKVRVRTGKPKTVTVQVPIYKTVKKTVKVKKGNRIVKVKKKVRVYTFEKCKSTGNSSDAGTPVKVQVLAGSVANLDFGAFQRQAPITGALTGFIPGGYRLNQDNQINLTRGNLALGTTNVFIDDDCHGGQVSAAIRTGNPTNVNLDPTKQSISTLTSAGGITATAYTKIQLPLELRNDDDGCDQPYITTGYTEFTQTFFLKGKIQKGLGLAKVTLTSPPDPLDVQACLSPGSPTSPCNNTALIIPLPIIVSTNLLVSIKVG